MKPVKLYVVYSESDATNLAVFISFENASEFAATNDDFFIDTLTLKG